MAKKNDKQTKMDKAKRPLLLGILFIYLLITIGYSVTNPLFEAPDEHHHFFTAVYMAENWQLPVADLQDEWLRQEAAQPPLAYILGGLLINPIDTSQATDLYWHNPQASIGDASALTNINWAVHDQNETFPWQNSRLAAYTLRFMSTVFGLGTLLCIYGSGQLLWPQKPEIALLATALVAFLPQFNFLHSAFNNDTLIIFLCSAALWQLLYLWQVNVTNGRLFLLGVTVGLAILTKNAGALLLIYSSILLILIWLKQPQHTPKKLLTSLLIFLLPALLLGGWLWLRNWLLYEDITAANVFVEFAGGDRQASLLQVLSEWTGIWPSLFAVLGWFNLRPPQWVYWIWNVIILGSLAGFIFALIKKGDWRSKIETNLNLQSPISNLNQSWFTVVWLAGWILAVYAGLVLFMLKTEAAQGRLLFPAILPLALTLAYGWSRWRWHGTYLLVPLAALITTLVSLFGVIQPAYALPPMLNELPAHIDPISADLGQGLQLLGADIETETAVPGDPVWLTLYWQTTTPITEPPEFTLEILGHGLELTGKSQGYHGRGLYPANLWLQQQIIADRFAVRLTDTIETPVLATAYVGLVDQDERTALGNIEIEPETWPKNDEPALAKIGDGVELTAVTIEPSAAQPGDLITVSVQWRVTAPPGQDLTTLVHFGQPGQPPLAFGDSQPLAGKYPTSLWEAGELIQDKYAFVIPEDVENGRYTIWLGLYEPETFARQPVTVDGTNQENAVFTAGYIDITN